MQLPLSPLFLVVTLVASTFAALTERALPKRYLDVSLRSNTILDDRIIVVPVDEHRLNKRLSRFGFELRVVGRTSIAMDKRGNEKVELLRRDEIINTPPPGTGDDQILTRRSTGTYEGWHAVVSVADDMVHDLQKSGVPDDQIPQYISEAVLVMDPETGFQYQLFPDGGSLYTDSHLDHTFVSLVYEIISA